MYVCKMLLLLLLLCCVSAGSVLSLHIFVLLCSMFVIWDHVMEILPSCMGCSHLTRVCKGMTVTGCNRDNFIHRTVPHLLGLNLTPAVQAMF